jgi:hypothetical protein
MTRASYLLQWRPRQGRQQLGRRWDALVFFFFLVFSIKLHAQALQQSQAAQRGQVAQRVGDGAHSVAGDTHAVGRHLQLGQAREAAQVLQRVGAEPAAAERERPQARPAQERQRPWGEGEARRARDGELLRTARGGRGGGGGASGGAGTCLVWQGLVLMVTPQLRTHATYGYGYMLPAPAGAGAGEEQNLGMNQCM